MTLHRTIRTRPRQGLAIAEVVTSALVSELLDPSPEFWLVSGWVSDITVIDNSHGDFDHLLEGRSGAWTLAAVLALLQRRGTTLRVALRDIPHNMAFVERLARQLNDAPFAYYKSPDLHEKLMCGRDWQLSGSMNFTWNGLERNEEAVEYRVDEVAAAHQRVELHQRWIGVAI